MHIPIFLQPLHEFEIVPVHQGQELVHITKKNGSFQRHRESQKYSLHFTFDEGRNGNGLRCTAKSIAYRPVGLEISKSEYAKYDRIQLSKS